MMTTSQHSPERAELTNIVREGYDSPQLNDHKQSCGLASAEGKPACIMPSDSNFAAGKFCTYSKDPITMNENIQLNEHNKAESPPMHTADHILNQTMVRTHRLQART